MSINQNADDHILEFVRSKFGTVDKTNFETQLYLCLPAFQPQEWEFYRTLTTEVFVLPLYALIVIPKSLCIALTAFRKWFAHPKGHINIGKIPPETNKNIDTTNAAYKATEGTNLHLRKNVASSEAAGVNTMEKRGLLGNCGNEDDKKGAADDKPNCNPTVQFLQTRFQWFLDYIGSSTMLRFIVHMDERPMMSFHICKCTIL